MGATKRPVGMRIFDVLRQHNRQQQIWCPTSTSISSKKEEQTSDFWMPEIFKTLSYIYSIETPSKTKVQNPQKQGASGQPGSLFAP